MANSKVELFYEVNKRSLGESIKSTETLQKYLKNIQVDKLNKEFAITTRELGKLKDSMASLKGDALDEARLKAVRFEEQLVSNQLQVERLNRELAETPKAGGADLGGIGSGLGAGQRLLGSLGAGGAADALGLGGDITDAIEGLPKLGKGIGELASTAVNATPLLSSLAGGIASAVPSIGAGGAAIAAIGIAAAPVAAVLGAIALGVAAFSSALNEANAAVDAAIIARQKELDLQLANVELSKTRSAEENRNIAQSEKEKLDILQAAIQEQQKLIEANARQYEELGASFDPFNRKRLSDEAGKLFEESERLTQQYVDLSASFGNTVSVLGPQIDAREKETQATQKQVEAERNLTLEREQAVAKAEQIQARIDALTGQSLQAQQSYNSQLRTITQDRKLRDTREEEDYQLDRTKALTDHQAKLADIAQQGQERIEAINRQLDALPAERQANLIAAEQKYNQDVSKINSDFMKSELVAVRKFAADEAKIATQVNRERIRALEDLGDDLADAEQANDVIRFLQIKRDGEKNIARQAQDADAAAQQRAEDFAAARADAEAQRAQRLSDVQQQLNDERAAIEAEAVKKRADLQKAAEAERAAIAQRVAAEVEGFRKTEQEQEASRLRRVARQREDDTLQDKRRSDALALQLQQIEVKKNAELLALNTIAARAGQLAASVPATLSSSFKPKKVTGTGGPRPTAFANEGVATRPTLATLAEREPEAVLRLPTLERLINRSGGGGQQIVIAPVFNVAVGDIATGSQVTSALQQFVDDLGRSINEGLQTARFNPVING